MGKFRNVVTESERQPCGPKFSTDIHCCVSVGGAIRAEVEMTSYLRTDVATYDKTQQSAPSAVEEEFTSRYFSPLLARQRFRFAIVATADRRKAVKLLSHNKQPRLLSRCSAAVTSRSSRPSAPLPLSPRRCVTPEVYKHSWQRRRKSRLLIQGEDRHLLDIPRIAPRRGRGGPRLLAVHS